MKAKVPVPWIETEDVANLVLYVASNKARYLTGSQFVLDAGLLTRKSWINCRPFGFYE